MNEVQIHLFLEYRLQLFQDPVHWTRDRAIELLYQYHLRQWISTVAKSYLSLSITTNDTMFQSRLKEKLLLLVCSLIFQGRNEHVVMKSEL